MMHAVCVAVVILALIAVIRRRETILFLTVPGCCVLVHVALLIQYLQTPEGCGSLFAFAFRAGLAYTPLLRSMFFGLTGNDVRMRQWFFLAIPVQLVVMLLPRSYASVDLSGIPDIILGILGCCALIPVFAHAVLFSSNILPYPQHVDPLRRILVLIVAFVLAPFVIKALSFVFPPDNFLLPYKSLLSSRLVTYCISVVLLLVLGGQAFHVGRKFPTSKDKARIGNYEIDNPSGWAAR